jgi:predicted lysophospholipase L1 biosynthesis ABC-type transport system permease subunit
MTERVFIRRAASLTIAAGILVLSASAQESTRSRTSAAVERTPALGAYFPLAPGHP